MSRLAAAAAVLLVALAAPSAALARSATGAEVRALARQAAVGDPGALAQLREIDRVDGVPVNLRRALAAGDEVSRRARLEALATPAGRQPTGTADARNKAAAILAESRFRTKERSRSGTLHRPTFLHRVGRTLSRWLRRVFGVGGGGGASAPSWFVWLVWLIALALVGLVIWAIARSVLERRRGPAKKKSVPAPVSDECVSSAEELLRLADEAERTGQLERALRLRFRAGLRRLQERRIVPWRDSLTSREVSRKLRSAEFDTLARTFDEVAYGRRPPSREDVAGAREAWPRVLDEAGSR